jgi:hypothetical protein
MGLVLLLLEKPMVQSQQQPGQQQQQQFAERVVQLLLTLPELATLLPAAIKVGLTYLLCCHVCEQTSLWPAKHAAHWPSCSC